VHQFTASHEEAFSFLNTFTTPRGVRTHVMQVARPLSSTTSARRAEERRYAVRMRACAIERSENQPRRIMPVRRAPPVYSFPRGSFFFFKHIYHPTRGENSRYAGGAATPQLVFT